MEDVTPGLLKAINKQFDESTKSSRIIRSAFKKLQNGTATYIDANNLSIEIGNILADALKNSITPSALPDQKMYFNIVNRILNETLKKNFDIVSGFSTDVQGLLNKQAKLGIKTQKPILNQDRIDGFINRISSEDKFEEVEWMLQDPVVNFSQSIVDDTIDVNAKFHSKLGLHPKLTRSLAGKACSWCKNLAGTYNYENAPKNIYMRHESCRCSVDYSPIEGKTQNSWTKKWS